MKGLCLIALAMSTYAAYIQIFNDNFDNLDNWKAQVMPGVDSGNNEWEYYTDRPVNVHVGSTPNGQALILRAQKEDYQGYNYTSGKVITNKEWGPYGFFNIKAVVPKGNAIWPAIWLLPPGAHNQYGGWAACGEIDIMETICTWGDGYSTLHFGGEWPKNVQYPTGGANRYPFSVDWSQPHYYGVEWQPSFMTFWFDAHVENGEIKGTKINTIDSSIWYSLKPDGERWPGNAPFNTPTDIILNVALGGYWPCSNTGCCDSVAVPAEMHVFNVQIWEQA